MSIKRKTHNTLTILDKMSPSDKERFWSKVDIKSEEECWEWKDSLSRDGYGNISIGSRENQHKLMAHRVAKTLSEGKEIEEGKLILHACDNPPCCNPSHLFIADHQANMDDMVNKGRSAKMYNTAKIDYDIADDIRKSELPGSKLANIYNLSESSISDIRNNKTWKEENRDKAIIPKETTILQMECDDNFIKYHIL